MLLILHNDLLKNYKNEREGMFIAEDNGRIVGTCFALLETPHQGRLDWVCADTDCQGKGIGTKLLNKAVSYLLAKGIKKIVVSTDRPMAMPFYLKHGFRIEHWALCKNFGEKPSAEDEIEKLLAAAGEYGKFHFSDVNSEIMRNNIKEIEESKNDSRKEKNLKLQNMIKAYWAFMYAVTDDTPPVLK